MKESVMALRSLSGLTVSAHLHGSPNTWPRIPWQAPRAIIPFHSDAAVAPVSSSPQPSPAQPSQSPIPIEMPSARAWGCPGAPRCPAPGWGSGIFRGCRGSQGALAGPAPQPQVAALGGLAWWLYHRAAFGSAETYLHLLGTFLCVVFLTHKFLFEPWIR